MAVKQVIVMRKDLKMRRGKEIAQGAHASCSFLVSKLRESFRVDHEHCSDDSWGYQDCYSPRMNAFDNVLSAEEREWLNGGFTKITLQVNSEEELMGILKEAAEAQLTTHLITDSGKTEFDGVPTRTCLAIGPHEESKIDKITGHLKLY